MRHAVQSFEGKENGDDKGKGNVKLVSKAETDSPSYGKTIWLHCSVGEPESPHAEEEAAPSLPTTDAAVGDTAEAGTVSYFADNVLQQADSVLVMSGCTRTGASDGLRSFAGSRFQRRRDYQYQGAVP